MDTLTAHTNYIVMAPSHPTDPALIKRVSQAMADIEAISEAHLPDIFEFGITNTATLTLFAVIANDNNSDAVKEELNARLNGGFFNKKAIAIKIIPMNFPLLQSIRDTDCLVGWRD